MTYEEYLVKITETIKIRSVNYRLSHNDIVYMTNNVFTEIASEVNFDPFEQVVTITEDNDKYDLEALRITEGHECVYDTYRIQNDNSVDVSKCFRKVVNNIFSIKDEYSKAFHIEYDGKNILFIREQIPDITRLSDRNQKMLFGAIVDGIMYYTHSAVPSPTGSPVPFNETGMYKTLYDKSISKLRDLYPQR